MAVRPLGALVIVFLAGCQTDREVDPAAFVSLVEADWAMPAGEEGYVCARVSVPEDLLVTELRPLAPEGTHHTALTVDLVGGEDGVFDCASNTLGPQMLFGAGVGTESFALPPGVAFTIPAGTQLLLNLHLYNYGEAELRGRSGIEVRRARPADVDVEAESLYITNFDLSVPSGQSSFEVACDMRADVTVFGVLPHMHRLGTHMKVVARREDGDELVLHDQAYSFEQQLNYVLDPAVPLHARDRVIGTCAYDNPGDPVVYGDSSDAEMCVLGLYRYPAQGGFSLCNN